MKKQSGYILDEKILNQSGKNIYHFPVFFIYLGCRLPTISNPISFQFVGGRTFGKKTRIDVAGEFGSDPNR